MDNMCLYFDQSRVHPSLLAGFSYGLAGKLSLTQGKAQNNKPKALISWSLA